MTIIEGKEYLTVTEFAKAVNKDRTYIYHLTTVGNAVRILKSIKVGSAVLIPMSEIDDFPFKTYRTKRTMPLDDICIEEDI